MNSYLRQKANFLVSLSVLAGGLAAAIILAVLINIENDLNKLPYYDEVVLDSEY